MIKTAELTVDEKYFLNINIVKFVECNRDARKIKRDNYNNIDEKSPDYIVYKKLDNKAYEALNEIIKIKKYTNESGYHGKSSQDLARKYANKNYHALQK